MVTIRSLNRWLIALLAITVLALNCEFWEPAVGVEDRRPVALERATAKLNIPFERYYTRDPFGRQITFYISRSDSAQVQLPLAVFIQGSGCHSLFSLCGENQVCGGYQNLFLKISQGRLHILAVEKPGVNYLDNPSSPGTADYCSPKFLEEHTLPRWVAALSSAVRATQTLPNIDRSRMLVVGHSEGGIVAARLAAEYNAISHVAILSGSGPTQLFDIAEQAHSRSEIYKTFALIQKEPDSVKEFAWGHPYRRWSSFLATSTLDELLRSKAQVYLAHGTKDTSVPIAAFDVLRAELVRHGRNVTAERREGVGHDFNVPGQPGPEGMAEVLRHVVEWFLAGEFLK